jgi:hypothetical protein
MVSTHYEWTDLAIEEFKSMWFGGVHIYDMALHFNMVEQSIRAARFRFGLPERKISSWTEERSDYLKENWGHSTASAIAAKLNISRNAVIGRARRMGLEAKKSGPVTGVKRSQPRPVIIRPPAPPPREPFSWPEIPSLNIPLLELEDGQCRFPCDEGFCGHPIVYNSYCGQHARVSYRILRGLPSPF